MPSTSDSVARFTAVDSLGDSDQTIRGNLAAGLGEEELSLQLSLNSSDNFAPTDLSLGMRQQAEWRGETRSNGSRYSRYRGTFTAIKEDGSIVSWGDDSDSAIAILSGENIWDIASTADASAALNTNGSVLTWGSSQFGGEPSFPQDLSENVSQLFSSLTAFAALKNDGSVVSWGPLSSTDYLEAYDLEPLVDVHQIVASDIAFAALQDDGSVVTWGESSYLRESKFVDFSGGVRKLISTPSGFFAIKNDDFVVSWGDIYIPFNLDLSGGVQDIFVNDNDFAFLKKDGSVVTGWATKTLENSSRTNFFGGVRSIVSTPTSFAAIKNDGSVVTWGDPLAGGDSEGVDFSGGVHTIVPSYGAFAAIKNDGSVVAWGNPDLGGDLEEGAFSQSITDVVSSYGAFTATQQDGSIVTWGNSAYGGDSNSVDFSGGVRSVVANNEAFAAIKNDGSVVTWGSAGGGGDSSSVAEQLASGIVSIPSSLDNHFIDVSSFNENLAENSLIARFRTTDLNPNDQFTYTLVAGEGDRDNAAFTIQDDQLRIQQSPDYETQRDYSIRVRTTDSAGGFYEEELSLSVNDIDEVAYPGRLDRNFGGDGQVVLDIAGGRDTADHVIGNRDGTITIVGTTTQLITQYGQDLAIVRYDSNGSLDKSFGDGGLVVERSTTELDYTQIISAVEDSYGGLLVTTYETNLTSDLGSGTVVLTRYDRDGKRDTDFSIHQQSSLLFGPDANFKASSLELDSTGNIILSGSVTYPDGNSKNLGIVRYTKEGLLDLRFSDDGKTLITLNDDDSGVNLLFGDTGIYKTGDGELIDNGFRATRYFNDGSLDQHSGQF